MTADAAVASFDWPGLPFTNVDHFVQPCKTDGDDTAIDWDDGLATFVQSLLACNENDTANASTLESPSSSSLPAFISHTPDVANKSNSDSSVVEVQTTSTNEASLSPSYPTSDTCVQKGSSLADAGCVHEPRRLTPNRKPRLQRKKQAHASLPQSKSEPAVPCSAVRRPISNNTYLRRLHLSPTQTSHLVPSLAVQLDSVSKPHARRRLCRRVGVAVIVARVKIELINKNGLHWPAVCECTLSARGQLHCRLANGWAAFCRDNEAVVSDHIVLTRGKVENAEILVNLERNKAECKKTRKT